MDAIDKSVALRTRVYVDGYNLYYGCLKRTRYKWLDPLALANRILPSVLFEQNGVPTRYELCAPSIKYFTAPILNSFARASDSVACQSQYHAALRGYLGGDIQIIAGYYDARRARAHSWIGSKPASECPMVDIWKLEEKQSDVALALHAFSDAALGDIDQIVVISNDSDFAPAMKMIRERTSAVLGVVAPSRAGSSPKKVNRELDKYAHWTRTHILDEELAASQLPSMVRLATGAVHKPLTWYPCPHLLIPVYEEAKRLRGSSGAARKWLNEPCAALEDRVPIEMCTSREGARELLAFLKDGAADRPRRERLHATPGCAGHCPASGKLLDVVN